MIAPLLLLTTAKFESYLEYVARSVSQFWVADTELARLLSTTAEPLITMETLTPLVAENIRFLDSAAPDDNTPKPSDSAPVAVPLLVQFVRDWSSAGEKMRSITYQPIVEAIVPFLLGRDNGPPRILCPGSGTGRLPFMVAEQLRGAQIIALDPDANAQRAAALMFNAAADDAPISLPTRIFPSLHVSNNWAKTEHRLLHVDVPDVPIATIKSVEASTNVTFAVGSLEDAADEWEAGGALDGDNDDGTPKRRDFDAVATCFVLDVLTDIRSSLRALYAMLAPTRGLWANLGPLAYPEPGDGMLPPTAGGAAASGRVILNAAQILALVKSVGFEVIEERLVEGCEYNALPHRLERTVRTCLFFIARPPPQERVEVGARG